MRRGQGTIGGRVPEGMMSREVACEPSQDVFALAHMVLLTLTKDEWKSSNMWVSKAALCDDDQKTARRLEEQNVSGASKHQFLDKVTLRNQIDPRARAALLNPEHLYDGLTDDVKEKVIILLTKALSPDPTKRPPMADMLAELDDMNDCLLEIETQGVISAVATAAVAGGGPSRTASTDAGEAGVTDGHGAPHPPPPVPDTLEAVSRAVQGGVSAVPDQSAAVAGVNVIIPAIIPEVAVDPAASRETADGSAAAAEEEGGGGGRSALAPLATLATGGQGSTVSRPLQEGSVPVSEVVSGGLPSHDGPSGGGNHVVPAACAASIVQSGVVTGGSAAVVPVSAGAGGGVAATAAVGGGRRVVDSQAPLLQCLLRLRSPQTCDVAAADRVGRANESRGTGLVPRALAVNDATAPYVVEGGDGGGLRTSHHNNRLPAGPAPRRPTTRRNAAGGARMDDGRVTNSHRSTNTARGRVPPFAHRQRRCKSRGPHGQGRTNANHGGHHRGSRSHGSSSSPRQGHHQHHPGVPLTWGHHHLPAAANDLVLPQPQFRAYPQHQRSWGVAGVGAAPSHYVPSGSSTRQMRHGGHVGGGGRAGVFLPPQAPVPLPPVPQPSIYRDPRYAGGGGGCCGWGVPRAPGHMQFIPGGAFVPAYYPMAAGVNGFPPRWQRTCVVR
ncbi:unnamed protein product [Ectocarpus sp. 12 AP-2014]